MGNIKDEIKVGTKFNCMWNEGYWSIGDVRTVTKVFESGFTLDGLYYYTFGEFKFSNYRVFNHA